jgi:hypothetical protein
MQALIDSRGLRYGYPDSTLALDECITFLDPPEPQDHLEPLRQLPQAKIAVFFQRGKIIGGGKPSEALQKFSWTPQRSTGGTMRPALPGN